MYFIDTHNHLGCEAFATDRSQVINKSVALGVIRQIIISIFQEEWSHDIQFVDDHPSLIVACGIHPMYIPPAIELQSALIQLKELFKQNRNNTKLCAVGEIGLDYFIDSPDKPLQQSVFKQQLALADAYQRPALLHVRRAHADTIHLLKAIHFKHGGIVHAFSGSYEEAKEYIKLGFKIGLGGAGTYPQAHRMHKILQQLPLDSIVLETDAPDLSPVSQQGQRNSPEFLPEICAQLAQIKGVSTEQLAKESTHNACKLFNWVI